MMETLNVYFTGRPGDDKDMLAHEIITKHGGKVIAAGTFLPDMQRDLQCEVPIAQLKACENELVRRGFGTDCPGIAGEA